MDLSPAQRVLAFLGIVVVLGGMGAYLLIPGVRSALGQGPAAASPSPTAPATGARGTSRAVPPASTAPAAPPSPTPSGSAPDIYQWLPFSQADLAKAASVAEAFGAAYDTYSYRESTSSYVASMSGLATSELSATLARAYGTPGVASQRTQQQQVASARTVINSIRTFGSGSLTFVVTIVQTMHTKQGKSRSNGQFAITLTGSGQSWLVNDIELASAGEYVSWRFSFSAGRLAVLVAIGVGALLVTAVAVVPMAMVGGASMLFAAGVGCPSSGSGATTQPAVTTAARNSIPSDYLALFKQTGQQYGVPWVLLAGIGKVESDDGQANLPGVHSGQNGFGAAGPMQIGIGGASTNTWGGAPVHPASEAVGGVATDANGDGVASVYEPADAIAGAAKYLLAHGVQNNVSGAIFAYNHLQSYVQTVLYWAGVYSRGGYTESNTTTVSAPECLTSAQTTAVPNQVVSTAIGYAREQLGKPYLFGGTGPDAFDCSGLMMMAYRAAGISIPRTSQQQWAWGPKIPASQVRPGDLVFFAGSDGTPTAPGHVGLVIGKGMMLEAYATGFPIRISAYGTSAAAPR